MANKNNEEAKMFLAGICAGFFLFVIGVIIFNATNYVVIYKNNQEACVWLNSPSKCNINSCYEKYNISVTIEDEVACLKEKIGEKNNEHQSSICQPVETR